MRRTSGGRRRLGIAATAGLAGLSLLAGACGSSGGGGQVNTATPVELTQGYLAQVADATTAAKTGRMEMNATTSGKVASLDISQTITGTGSYDIDRGLVSQRISSSMKGQSFEMEIVNAGTTAYERSSVFSMIDPALDGKWLKISIDDDTGGAMPGGADPAAMLDYLRASGATIDDKGTTDIDGVQVHHLHTTASLKNLAGKVSDERMKKMEKAMSGVPGADAATKTLALEFEMDVYVDADNRVRRIELSGDLSQALPVAAKGTITIHETVDYSDFGQPVTITVPDDADTVDGLAALKHLGGTAGIGTGKGETTTTTR